MKVVPEDVSTIPFIGSVTDPQLTAVKKMRVNIVIYY